MMASKLLKPHTGQPPRGLHGVINRNLDRVSAAYGRVLDAHVGRTWIYVVVMVLSLLASALLLKVLPSELAPAEDRG